MTHKTPDKYRYPTKKQLAEAWAEWFDSKTNEWHLYTVTAVFKATGFKPSNQAQIEDEYYKRVLDKFRKRLEPNQGAQATAIPFDRFFYYEKNIGSIYKLSGSRSPHHIHALLPITKHQDHRLWCDDLPEDVTPRRWARDNYQSLHPRLIKDLESIDTLQDLLIEPVREQGTVDWVGYISKCKQI